MALVTIRTCFHQFLSHQKNTKLYYFSKNGISLIQHIPDLADDDEEARSDSRYGAQLARIEQRAALHTLLYGGIFSELDIHVV